jgi:hypothetical protein
MLSSGKTILKLRHGRNAAGWLDGIGGAIAFGQVHEAADSPQDLACLYFVGAVIEQAVRDWRLARRIGFIDRNGEVNGDMIQGYYRNSSNYKLPTAFDGPADIETLASFFNRGGLEVWLRFAGFNVDADTIIAGLEKVTAVKPKIGHLLKAEHEQSGNYYADMEWRTI